MTGYVFAIGSCVACRRPMTFNPSKVPSSSIVTGAREPICRVCMERINNIRGKLGMEHFPVAPDAYEACPEEELEH